MRLKFITLTISVALVLVGLFLDSPSKFGICYEYQVPSGVMCIAPYASISAWLLPFASALLAASVLAFFTTRTTFRRWSWFTLWYGIVAAILMYLAARAGIDDGGFISIPLFDIEKVAYLLAGIYLVLSLSLLGISDLLVRRKR